MHRVVEFGLIGRSGFLSRGFNEEGILRIVPRDHPLKCENHCFTASAHLRPGSVAWKIGKSEVAIAPIGQEDATTTTLK